MKPFSTWGITRNKTIPAKQKKTKPFFFLILNLFHAFLSILISGPASGTITHVPVCKRCRQSQCDVSPVCPLHHSSQTRALLCFRLQKTNWSQVRLAWQFPLCWLIKVKDGFHHRKGKKKKKKTSAWKYFSAYFHHPRRACRRMLNWCTRCPECPLCSYFCSFLKALVKEPQQVL